MRLRRCWRHSRNQCWPADDQINLGTSLPIGISGEIKHMNYICVDCSVDTTPCTGKRRCRHAGKWEHYMVTAEVWRAAGMPAPTVRGYDESDGDFLCVGCLEGRLGRVLVPADFTRAPINGPSPWDTPRLAARKREAPKGVYFFGTLREPEPHG